MSALLYSLRPLSAGFVSSLLRARWGTEENRRAALCPRSLASRFSTPRLSKGTGLGKVRAQETMRGGAHVLCTAREERPGDRVARLGARKIGSNLISRQIGREIGSNLAPLASARRQIGNAPQVHQKTTVHNV